MRDRRYKVVHKKTRYDGYGEPFDRKTILKVGDTVRDVKSKLGLLGTVVKMTRSKNTEYGYIDWFVKVELINGKSIWNTGPYRFELIKPVEGGPRLKRKVK